MHVEGCVSLVGNENVLCVSPRYLPSEWCKYHEELWPEHKELAEAVWSF